MTVIDGAEAGMGGESCVSGGVSRVVIGRIPRGRFQVLDVGSNESKKELVPNSMNRCPNWQLSSRFPQHGTK